MEKHKAVCISLFTASFDTHFFLGLISFLFALCQVLDCNFDDSTFCEWANDNSGKSKFNWTLQSGQTPSGSTGPISDVSGINSLFDIDPLSLTVRNIPLNNHQDRIEDNYFKQSLILLNCSNLELLSTAILTTKRVIIMLKDRRRTRHVSLP